MPAGDGDDRRATPGPAEGVGPAEADRDGGGGEPGRGGSPATHDRPGVSPADPPGPADPTDPREPADRAEPAARRLTPSACARLTGLLAEPAAALPDRVGPYRVVRLLGQGGMGVVYLAEQDHPIRRTVALKLIKAGMDTREVIARFRQERQALAAMAHPNVARVLDAGASADGRPYFVMEYVAGEPITAYCDRHRLPVRRRLELFLQACEAVQHAHQKAILHRDLKPSNILAAGEDPAAAEVKVIDFGVAKALDGGFVAGLTLHTEAGQLLGTPDYMSPEQANGDGGSDVHRGGAGSDTRSDVYSLGVVLYELLAGVLPFDPAALRASGVESARRIIREVDPPRPGARLSSLGHATATAVAADRGTPWPALRRELSGELAWIPLKAMRKEPDRRYAGVAELARDVRNYLENRPLAAGPESRAYRLRKFVRRNRGKVAAGVSVGLTLMLGLAVSTTLAIRLNITSDAMRQSLASLDQLGTQFWYDLKFAESEPLVREAFEGRRRFLGDDHPATLESLNTLGAALVSQRRFNEAEPLLREALERRRRTLGCNHPDTLLSIGNLALVLDWQDKLADAEALYAELLERERAAGLAPDPINLARLGVCLTRMQRYREAEPVLRQYLDGIQSRPVTTTTTRHAELGQLQALFWALAEICKNTGRPEEAAAWHAELTALRPTTQPSRKPASPAGMAPPKPK